LKTKLQLHQVFLDGSILDYPYLCKDIVSKHTMDDGSEVLYMTCTKMDTSHFQYLEATVSVPPNGEPRHVLLRHSFVVAILEVTNLQNQLGFASQGNNEQ